MDTYITQGTGPDNSAWWWGYMVVQSLMTVLLVAVGAWLAIRFEKWREHRERKA
jgi:hypothetical protein